MGLLSLIPFLSIFPQLSYHSYELYTIFGTAVKSHCSTRTKYVKPRPHIEATRPARSFYSMKGTMKSSRVLLISLLVVLAGAAQAAVTISTDKGDNGRSGTTPSETTLTLQNVNSTNFGLQFE